MEKYWLTAIAILLLVIAFYAVSRKFRRANPWGKTPYERQEYFLSPAEKQFYDVLQELVGEEITICPKPSVREVLRVRDDVKRDRLKYFNWISQKHVDFVLCDRETMQILCAVELDDRTHERSDRRQRDAFLDKAFAKRGFHCFIFPASRITEQKNLIPSIVFSVRICWN